MDAATLTAIMAASIFSLAGIVAGGLLGWAIVTSF
jgi:hypothetical protein